MPKLVPYLNTDAEPGEQLSPEMRTEIREVAPSTLVNDAVTTPRIRDLAVTTEKVADGAVTSPKIAAKGVKRINLDDGVVGPDQLDTGSVTAVKAGLGVATAHDADGNPIACDFVFLTQTEFAAVTEQPGVTYMVKADG